MNNTTELQTLHAENQQLKQENFELKKLIRKLKTEITDLKDNRLYQGGIITPRPERSK